MTAAMVRPELLDEAAASFLESEGRVFVVLGLIRCAHDGFSFVPVVGAAEAAYECATGHRVAAEAVETEMADRFIAQFTADRQRVRAPENIRRMLLKARVSALVDVYAVPLIERMAIGHPIF